jgi:hypothetical protein
MNPPLLPPQEAALREAAQGAATVILSPSTLRSIFGELDRLRTKLSAAGLLYDAAPAPSAPQPRTLEDLL